MNVSQAQSLITGKGILPNNQNVFGYGPLFNLIYAEAFMDFSDPYSIILPMGFPFFLFIIPAFLFYDFLYQQAMGFISCIYPLYFYMDIWNL